MHARVALSHHGMCNGDQCICSSVGVPQDAFSSHEMTSKDSLRKVRSRINKPIMQLGSGQLVHASCTCNCN